MGQIKNIKLHIVTDIKVFLGISREILIMKLEGAVALITGGALGIGKKLAETLLQKGTTVIIADINEAAGRKLEEDSQAQFGDNRFKFLKCDLRDSKQLHDTFDAAKAFCGRLDIVCNNAGIISLDTRAVIDINLTSVIEGTFKGIELMSKKKNGDQSGGVIVNTASAAGLDVFHLDHAPGAVYSATKHAVIAFTRCFNTLPHHVDDGVRVNCICPSYVETDMVKNVLKEDPPYIKKIESFGGFVEIEDVVEGMMRCIVTEDMNAKAIVIQPPNKIFEMRFPKVEL